MAIYLVGFDVYPNEIKVGLSTNTVKRISDHIKEHGEISKLTEWKSEGTSKDKIVERYILNNHRAKLSSIHPYKTSRKGWTEFIDESEVISVEKYLDSQGYTKTNLCMSDFSEVCRPAEVCGGAIESIGKALVTLRIVDSIILTCKLNDLRIPDTVGEFNDICTDLDLDTDWFDNTHLSVARKFSGRYPYGFLQLEQ